MAGADVAVTDRALADLVLQYAKELGRSGTTDTIAIPIARPGHASEADLLLGPASQIALTENEDSALEAVELPGVERVSAEIRERLESLGGRPIDAAPFEESDGATTFTDFDDF
jgi:hypothetical protein